MKDILKLAKQLSKQIGGHYHMIGKGVDADIYYEAQRQSDEAQALAKYLIQHLSDDHMARTFAHAVGMPGYVFNLR